jgi:hypothetical protein
MIAISFQNDRDFRNDLMQRLLAEEFARFKNDGTGCA